MSKEKFELVFLAGGTLLDVLGTRLRRAPATPRESVGAAVHTLGQVVDEHREQLADADAVGRQIAMIRQELCAEKPRRAVLAGCVEELVEQVRAVAEVAEAAEQVRTQVSAYLRLRFGGWSLT
jgi:hypothetical protein